MTDTKSIFDVPPVGVLKVRKKRIYLKDVLLKRLQLGSDGAVYYLLNETSILLFRPDTPKKTLLRELEKLKGLVKRFCP